MPDLFIGVVSHEHSRFSDAQGPQSLAEQLAHVLNGLGCQSTVRVNTEDFLAESGRSVSPNLARRNSAAELRLEREWAHFLGVRQGFTWWARHLSRWAKYWISYTKKPDISAVTRLINIELSHMDLLRHGVNAEAKWVLILEDDAGCTQIDDLALGLFGIMQGQVKPSFANISQSFDLAVLGIGHLLSPVTGEEWRGSETRSLLASSVPATNTVCAILYRGGFARDLIATLNDLPLEPVPPIDWKLNQALMHMNQQGQISAGSCWWVEPGPILQRSMIKRP